MHSIYVFYLWRSENSLQGVSSLLQPRGSQGWTRAKQQGSLPTEPSHWPSASQSAVRMFKDAAVITQEHLATERNHWAQPGGWQHPENFWKNKAVCGVNREKWLQIASTNFGNDNNYISNLKRKQLSSERGGGEGDWEHAYKLGGNQRKAEDERRRSHQNKEQRAARWE